MKPITYLKGDATLPKKHPAAICHICNNVGKWGRGFVLGLSNRFSRGPRSPEGNYREWARTGSWDGVAFKLGQTQSVRITEKVTVFNMIAQDGIRNNRCNFYRRLFIYRCFCASPRFAAGKCLWSYILSTPRQRLP